MLATVPGEWVVVVVVAGNQPLRHYHTKQLLSLDGNSLKKDVGIVTGDEFPNEGDLGGALKHQLYYCCFQHCHSRLQN